MINDKVFTVIKVGRDLTNEYDSEITSIMKDTISSKKKRVLQIIEVGTGDVATEITNLNDFSSFEFSRDGKYLVIGSAKGTVTVWVISGTIRSNINQVLDSMAVNPNFWNNYPLYLSISGSQTIEDEIKEKPPEVFQESASPLSVPKFNKEIASAPQPALRSINSKPITDRPLPDTFGRSYIHPPQNFMTIDYSKPPPPRSQQLRNTQGSRPELVMPIHQNKFQRPYTFYDATKNLYEKKNSAMISQKNETLSKERVIYQPKSIESESVTQGKKITFPEPEHEERKNFIGSQEDAIEMLLDKQHKGDEIAPDPDDIDQEEEEEEKREHVGKKKSISGMDSISGCDVVDKMYDDIQTFDEKYDKRNKYET